jgi:hypothetical protein
MTLVRSDLKLKFRKLGIDRRFIAMKLKIPYNRLNQMLNGFIDLPYSVETEINRVIKEIERKCNE